MPRRLASALLRPGVSFRVSALPSSRSSWWRFWCSNGSVIAFRKRSKRSVKTTLTYFASTCPKERR